VTQDFYDQLAPLYHLVFDDWDASMRRQGEQLDAIIRAEWHGSVHRILDAAAGIGTQAIPLASLGYEVTASDLSSAAIGRAQREARSRGLRIRTSVADLRQLSQTHATFDLVLACDNALPHLLTDADILQALRECLRCTAPGGGCLLSMRDYAATPGEGSELRPYGVRHAEGRLYYLYQVWTWDGPHYDVTLCITEDTGSADLQTKVFRSRYYAIPVDRVRQLMVDAGFSRVRRLDDVYYQPLLIGSRPCVP
jgi:SAM-dependent methyltransferase